MPDTMNSLVCKKCGTSDSVVPTVLTTLVQRRRCLACGRFWSVARREALPVEARLAVQRC